MASHVSSAAPHRATLELLKQHGVKMEGIAEITLFLQASYIPGLTLDQCLDSVQQVLEKREVQSAILTGIELDILAEREMLSLPLQQIVTLDESLYGVDETLVLSILNIYDSIGYTNYGYVDKLKHGALTRLNDHACHRVHTFLDDLTGSGRGGGEPIDSSLSE